MAILAASSLTLAASAQSFQYALDDGTAEFHTGIQPYTGTISWMNEFTVVSGGEVLTSVSLLMRSGPSLLPNGHPISVRIWSDPNGDGVPFDAALLRSASHQLQGAGSGAFFEYDIPDIALAPGERFFVGITTQYSSNQFPAGFDGNAPHQQRSWISNAVGELTPGSFLRLDIGDLTVRANAVPEPATLAVLALATLGVIRKRKGPVS